MKCMKDLSENATQGIIYNKKNRRKESLEVIIFPITSALSHEKDIQSLIPIHRAPVDHGEGRRVRLNWLFGKERHEIWCWWEGKRGGLFFTALSRLSLSVNTL